MRLFTVIWMALACVLPALPATNFLVILTDDLGLGDVRAYNRSSRIPTPSMDRLAAEGVRFTDAHSPDGVCTPTRYGLLTGRYAWRTRLKRGVLRDTDPPLIAQERLTVADMLRERGYMTGAVGKWHLGLQWKLLDGSGAQTVANVDWSQPAIDGPAQHGFDYSFGMGKPAWTFMENGRVLARPTLAFDLTHLPAYLMGGNNNTGTKAPGFEFERMLPRYTEEAVGFIDSASSAGKPWFLYFTPLAPHRPVVPNKDFQGRSAAGLYGDFVAEVDWSLGELLAAVDRSGQADDTLVIFTSENGPESDAYRRILEYRHASMGGLRGVKRDLWEGGHRVPFLARWPRRIAPGTRQDEVLCLTDVMATLAAIVGYDLPADAAEDSYDMTDALVGADMASPIREATVHHGSRGWFAIRQGDWVLIDHPTGNNNGAGLSGEPAWLRRERQVAAHDLQVELFNLRDDPAQTTNLAGTQAERVRSLKRLLERYKNDGRSVARP